MNAKEKDINSDAERLSADKIAVEKKKTGEKNRIGAFLRSICQGSLFALCAYFLGGAALPYGAMPLGVAFLAVSDRRVFYIYGGLVAAALSSERRVLLIGVYSAMLILRLLTRLMIDSPWKKGEETGEKTVGEVYPYMFSEHIAFRAALSAVGAFAIGAHRLIEGGMLYYDMYGAIISTLSAPAAVLLTGGFFKEDSKRLYRIAGLAALSMGVIYSVGELKLYGVSLALFGCMMVTLYISKTYGAVAGALSGAALGLTVGVGSAPIFVFSGLVAGLLFPVSTVLALLGALSVGAAWGVYSEGLNVLNGTLSALVSATLIFGMWDKLYLTVRARKTESAVAEPSADELRESLRSIEEKYMQTQILLESERLRAGAMEERIRGFSEGLSSISELLYNMSRNLTSPCYSDLKQICDGAFENLCCGCDSRESCWRENYRVTTDALSDICSAVQKKGQVDAAEVSEELRERCGRLSDILSQINHNTYLHARQLFENDRTELFATDFEATAELIRGYLESGEQELLYNERLSYELERRLVALGVGARGASVFGDGKKSVAVFFDDPQDLPSDEKEIGECVAAVCGAPMSAPYIDRAAGVMRFTSAPRLTLSFAKTSRIAEGEEEFCGDTAGFFEGGDGKHYAFISDGMGSGREAAMTSGLCGMFLRSILSHGGAEALGVLRLLNGFLRNRGGGSLHECSSTIDLMEIDPYLCRASFYKSGAAPTYVYRNGSLFKLRSHTVPVGIIRELDFRKIDMELSEGDLVVMVSDGVTDGREECPWLFDLLRAQSAQEPERIAELIVKYAKSEGATDDITALVIKPRFD